MLWGRIRSYVHTHHASQVKNHARFEFPTQLDLSKVTVHDAFKPHHPMAGPTWASGEHCDVLSRPPPDGSACYKLIAVVVHAGTAKAGNHYVLACQHGDGLDDVWWMINDTAARPYELEDLPRDAFGGVDDSGRNIYRSAVVLVYKRVGTPPKAA